MPDASSRPLLSTTHPTYNRRSPIHSPTGSLHSLDVTVASSFKSLLTTHLYFNIAAAILVPLAIASSLLKWGDIAVFSLNFLAIIPLAKMLDFATDQLSMRVGPTIGGLLNASFGNAVELILGALALKEGLVTVVQASLIGSILSNLLLVLGACFLLGGLVPFKKNSYQKFDTDLANLDSGLLSLVVLSFIIPAAYFASTQDQERVVEVSRGTAVVLFVTYIAFLVFSLGTNPDGLLIDRKAYKKGLSNRPALSSLQVDADPSTVPAPAPEDDDDDEEHPTTLAWVAAAGLLGATLIIAVCAEFLVDSVEGLSEKANISETFIGIIILPIVGNAAEHVTAVSSAMRDKVDLAIQVAIGSSMQIALFVTPLLVIIGWIINVELTLDFKMFETSVLFVSIFVVNSLVHDGKTHWLEGWMLLASYVIIGVAFYYI
ncbi:hypothetical protein HDV05_002384 [Chytridiales sp. JEL 0842]|nr:hypothetical protein HDV05_002384 [Chytridiales sp. JEL 0842]